MNFVLFALLGLLTSGSAFYENGDVFELTSANFQQLVIQSDFVWLVQFYDPWSVPRNFEFEYYQLATDLKNKIKVGAINGRRYNSLREQYNVTDTIEIKIFGVNKSLPYTALLDYTAEAYRFIVKKFNSSSGVNDETFKFIIECAMLEKARLEREFNNDDEDSRDENVMEGSGNDENNSEGNVDRAEDDLMTTLTPDYPEYDDIKDIETTTYISTEMAESIATTSDESTAETSDESTTESWDEFSDKTSPETVVETTDEASNLDENKSGVENSAVNIKNLSKITVNIILISLFKLLFFES